MVEVIGKHPPVNVLTTDDEDEEDASRDTNVEEKEAEARMKIIAQFAREVLLSHVKKDVNLSTYPGKIVIPGDLYRARTSVSPVPRAYESDDSDEALPPPLCRRGRRPFFGRDDHSGLPGRGG